MRLYEGGGCGGASAILITSWMLVAASGNSLQLAHSSAARDGSYRWSGRRRRIFLDGVFPALCGRYTLRTPPSHWLPLFAPGWEDATLASQLPRYNIAPTQSIAVVVREVGTPRQVRWMRWGLVPPWAKDVSIGHRMINARAETVAEKPSFRHALASRRGLVIADGYYEWKTTAEGKQPFLIERVDRGVFAFAGLWEENRKASADSSVIRSCTIVTTQANSLTAAVHDRMPVVLPPEHHQVWLDPACRDTAKLQSLLVPLENDVLRLTPVSKRVGNVRHDDADCVTPAGEPVLWK